MTSLIQSKFNRYDLLAILLPGMVSVVIFQSIISGSFTKTILSINDISVGGTIILIVASYLLGKFIQTLSTLNHDEDFWRKKHSTLPPEAWVLAFNDSQCPFLSDTIKKRILSKLGKTSQICPIQLLTYIPYIKEQCYRQQFVREELEQLEAEIQLYNSFHYAVLSYFFSYLSISLIKFPYNEIAFDFHFLQLALFLVVKLSFIGTSALFIRRICEIKYMKLSRKYYQRLFHCFAISTSSDKELSES